MCILADVSWDKSEHRQKKTPHICYFYVSLLASGVFFWGICYTLGDGTDLVCKSIEFLWEKELKGHDIEDVMSN